jgi:hypothetical protein
LVRVACRNANRGYTGDRPESQGDVRIGHEPFSGAEVLWSTSAVYGIGLNKNSVKTIVFTLFVIVCVLTQSDLKPEPVL